LLNCGKTGIRSIPQSLKPYLFIILKSAIFNHIRRERRLSGKKSEIVERTNYDIPSPAEQLVAKEQAGLRDAIVHERMQEFVFEQVMYSELRRKSKFGGTPDIWATKSGIFREIEPWSRGKNKRLGFTVAFKGTAGQSECHSKSGMAIIEPDIITLCGIRQSFLSLRLSGW